MRASDGGGAGVAASNGAGVAPGGAGVAASNGAGVSLGGVGTTSIGVAIDIPEPWGTRLTRRRGEAGDPRATYVPAHVTLLGPTEVASNLLPVVEEQLAVIASRHQPFTVRLHGTGTFRPVTEVVFVAMTAGVEQCEALATAIAAGDGIHCEARFPYHPHVTVAQDVPTAALDAVLADLAAFQAQFPVTAFTLFSHGGEGSWHPRRDFPLGR